MALATTFPTQDVNLTISLSDMSILKEIKKTLSLFRGVEKVRTSSVADRDITKTAGFKEALSDKQNGRTFHADSVDEMFSQILG